MAELLEIFLSPDAARGLDRIYDPLFSEILQRLEFLRTYPQFGAAMPGRFSGWRATTVRMYRIIYRVTEDFVEVAYIRHCKRKPPKTG